MFKLVKFVLEGAYSSRRVV